MDIESISSTVNNLGIETTTESGDMLDKHAFMELLMVQMQNQDPLKPMDNSEMAAQMAQLGQLEQMENLNKSFEMFQQSTTSALSLMSAGRDVELELYTGEVVEGTLDKVQWSQGETQFVINDTAYSAGDVRSLRAVVVAPDAETNV